MSVESVIDVDPTSEQMHELNSASASLRASLIVLIIVIIIFAIMQIVKLAYQIQALRRRPLVSESFDSEVPQILVCAKSKKNASKKRSRSRRIKDKVAKRSLPSKSIKVQFSLSKEAEMAKASAFKNKVPIRDEQLPQDNLINLPESVKTAVLDNTATPKLDVPDRIETPVVEETLSPATAKDSLMMTPATPAFVPASDDVRLPLEMSSKAISESCVKKEKPKVRKSPELKHLPAKKIAPKAPIADNNQTNDHLVPSGPQDSLMVMPVAPGSLEPIKGLQIGPASNLPDIPDEFAKNLEVQKQDINKNSKNEDSSDENRE